jgi:hypothetical protein
MSNFRVVKYGETRYGIEVRKRTLLVPHWSRLLYPFVDNWKHGETSLLKHEFFKMDSLEEAKQYANMLLDQKNNPYTYRGFKLIPAFHIQNEDPLNPVGLLWAVEKWGKNKFYDFLSPTGVKDAIDMYWELQEERSLFPVKKQIVYSHK